jgi:hypothetical protein
MIWDNFTSTMNEVLIFVTKYSWVFISCENKCFNNSLYVRIVFFSLNWALNLHDSVACPFSHFSF